MNFFKKFNFNKNILTFILTSILSMMIFFYNDGNYVLKIKSLIFNFYKSASAPSQWYKDLLIIKKENELLSKELVQIYLLNSKLINYEIENKHIVNDIKNYEISPSPNSTIKQMLLYNQY